jgi:hypothetical protein
MYAAALQGPRKKSKSGAAADEAPPHADYKCLIRATDGKKKISTAVSLQNLTQLMCQKECTMQFY